MNMSIYIMYHILFWSHCAILWSRGEHAFWRAALAHFPEAGYVFFFFSKKNALNIACNNSIEVSAPPNQNHSVKILIWLNSPNMYLLSWARLRRLVAEGCSISSFEDLVELPSLKTLEPWSLGTAMSKGKLPMFFFHRLGAPWNVKYLCLYIGNGLWYDVYI